MSTAIFNQVETNTTNASSSSLIMKTANYTTLIGDATILVSPAANSTNTITLSTSESDGVSSGKKYIVKKANETNGFVTVVSQGGGTLEGNANLSTDIPYQGWVLQFDGTNWHIVGHI
jgi:hypothetical protein